MHGGGCVTGWVGGAVCHTWLFRGLYFLVFVPKSFMHCVVLGLL